MLSVSLILASMAPAPAPAITVSQTPEQRAAMVAKQLHRSMDADGNGVVGRDEMIASATASIEKARANGMTVPDVDVEAKVDERLALMDKDKDASVTLAELQKFVVETMTKR